MRAGAQGPYHALFQQMATGAARCRVSAGDDDVVEVVEGNPAFAAFREVVPHLHALLVRVRDNRNGETLRFVDATRTLSASAYPGDAEEVMVVVEDITAIEQLEKLSRESQQRFQQAFHGNAAAMVIAHRHDLRIIDVNPRWLELFGAARDEVIGRTTLELGLISEDVARARIAEHRQFAGGFETELALRTRAGTPLTVIASAKPITLPEGPCTLTTLLDITARKQAEEAFEAAFRAGPAGMMLVHAASDTIVAVNQRMLEMTGTGRDAFIGRKADEIVFVLSPPRADLLAEIARSGRLNEVEVALARSDGPPLSALASTETISLHDTRHRLTIFTDITVRKRVEDRLVAQHAIGRALAETADLSVAARVVEALCRCEDRDAGAVWLRSSDGLVRCGEWVRDPETPAIATDRVAELLPQLVAGGVPEPLVLVEGAATSIARRHAIAFPILGNNEVLGVIALAGDEAQPLDAAARSLFESIGRMFGLFVERTRAEASLRELNIDLERRVSERTHELESVNRELEAFTSTVSHDLRAPLRSIWGFSEVLLEDFATVLPAEATRLLTRIHDSGGRLRTLIDDLLEFSRIGRGELRRVEVALDPLVRAVIDELLVDRDYRDRVEFRVMPLGTADADPSLLRAVWTNLIDNALKYSRTREHIVIEIGRETRGDEVVYFVRDNGVGFDMAHADRLFGVFQRLHGPSEFEGTGVGLANVRRIVERHHGRVAATSEVDRGSRFEFTLGTA